MATTFSFRRLRCPLDLGSFELFRDQLTGSTPEMWRGNDYRVEIGAFVGLAGGAPSSDDNVVDVLASAWQSLTIEVKTAPSSVGNLMAKTVSAFTPLTAAGWNAFTAAHATVEFSAEETNIAEGSYHCVISVITTAGKCITLGASTLRVREDGAHLSVPAPPVNPGDAITLGQSDARYIKLGGVTWSNLGGKPFTAASAGGNGAADSGKAPLFGMYGGLTAAGIVLNGGDVNSEIISAASHNNGGPAIRLLHGISGTALGVSIGWDGTLEWSAAGRAQTRKNLGGFVAIATGNNAAQAVPSGVLTYLDNWQDDHDPSGAHAAGVITVPRTGTYLITVVVSYQAVASGDWLLDLHVGGAFARNIGRSAPLGNIISAPLTMRLVAGSVLRLATQQSSGASRNALMYSSNHFAVTELVTD